MATVDVELKPGCNVTINVNAVVGSGGGGGGGGIADDPWTEVDITSDWINGFGGAWDWGTGATMTMRWARLGRLVRGYIYGNRTVGGTETTSGFPVLPHAALPYEPYDLGVGTNAVTTNFAYVGVPETAPAAGDGYIVAVGPVLSNLGLGGMDLTFVHFDASPTDGGLGNVWLLDGGTSFGWTSTPDLTARAFSVQLSFEYEAATAA
jgi:hypothetical protein